MVDESEKQKVLSDIRSAYGSLDAPDFSFVGAALERRPYDEVVRRLAQTFAVEEETDADDDVSFGYLLAKGEKRWLLRLSMVGPYAVLFRLFGPRNVKLVSPVAEASEPEAGLLRTLSDGGLRLLGAETLLAPVGLSLFNTEPGRARVYQALFSDTDVLPWVQ